MAVIMPSSALSEECSCIAEKMLDLLDVLPSHLVFPVSADLRWKCACCPSI